MSPRAGSWFGPGLAVLAANAGLLVLQLVTGRLLAPFVGSSLETWTAVIGVNLAGIAAGSEAGAWLVRRGRAGPGPLAGVLLAGAAAAGWAAAGPHLVAAAGLDRALPWGVRIPVLAAGFGFPAAVLLSVPTPLAVQLAGGRAGRAAGRAFALATAGSLAGNYLTGFTLIPSFTLDAIVGGTAAGLAAVAGVVAVTTRPPGGAFPPLPSGGGAGERAAAPGGLSFRRAALIVFLASFAGMAMELVAARLLAQAVGVSLTMWTGVIGVVLAGTAAGNVLGGALADRAGGRLTLAACLTLAAVAVTGAFAVSIPVNGSEAVAEYLEGYSLAADVVIRSAALFFVPAVLLGTVSPQVVRRVAGPGGAGSAAGRVYAASTAGALAGTLAGGYALIPAVGAQATLLVAAALPGAAALVAGPVWRHPALLGSLALVAGGAFAGVALIDPAGAGIVRETGYYTITVKPAPAGAGAKAGVLTLELDKLIHSWVRPGDPAYLFYTHEQTQLEFLRAAGPAPRALVIGGGGYTFPRAARTLVPDCAVDVVEIDPGVTAVAYSHLGLDPALEITTHHMDGRRFLAESAPPGGYHLVTLDAVTDFAVPAHLLTRECHRAAKRALAPDGVYLVTVIDILAGGGLWPATVHTLREEFRHVAVLQSFPDPPPGERAVYCLYAADAPLDLARLAAAAPAGAPLFTRRTDPALVERLLARRTVVLTDQYAPVDALMRPVYRR